MSHLEMVPWGVLGQGDHGASLAPDPSTTTPAEVVVDPAGEDHIASGSMTKAAGLSGELYKWRGQTSFRKVVMETCIRTGDARFCDYGTGQLVIHVITPDTSAVQ